MNIKEYPAESCRGYYADGQPAYTIVGKNGKERNITLADMKILNIYPSVTEILKIYPKPYLQLWKQRQVLMSALTLTRLKDESDDALIARIMADADEQARIAREKGQAIHGAMERFICGQEVQAEYYIYVGAAINVLQDYLGEKMLLSQCEPEKSFACPDLLYGGKVDLFSRELRFVCDIKSSEFTEDKTLGYQEHIIQLSAYSHGLQMPDARIINLYISTKKPGLIKIIEYSKDQQCNAFAIFKKCLELWQLLKKYPIGGIYNDA
mgnify:CR=1 FL=1